MEAKTDELKVGEYMTPNPVTVLSDKLSIIISANYLYI
jgi:hypothetical protein